jgi:aryl-alcohol dehydrogenase-like predicted oxidoreductase
MTAYRTLGKSGLKVTEIGLGCWAIGGPSFSDDGYPNGWAGNDDRESARGLRKAFELGINHWDTADVYGRGHSERLIGQVLREGIARDQIVLASKVGWFKGTADHAFEPLHIRHQVEQSLRNLSTDYLDIYYLHNAYFGDQDKYLEPAAEVMHQLKKEGKIRAVGQSAYSLEQFKRAVPVVKPEVLQLPYNALSSPFDKPEEDVFKWADERDLGIVMFGTYAKGLLLGKYDHKNPPQFERGDIRENSDQFKKDFLQKLEPALNSLRRNFGEAQSDLARIANQYALSRSQNAVAIPGFKNMQQVKDNFETMGYPLSGPEKAKVEEIFAVFK